MFKKRIFLVIGVASLLLVTMAVSRPFASTSLSSIEGANDFYQRHPGWNVNAEASDYYERHPELSMPVENIVDAAGDFSLRHPEWVSNLQRISVPVTGSSEFLDYFQRHPELSAPAESTDLSDYFLRH